MQEEIMTSSQKRYSLLLINPKLRYRYHWDLKEICTIMRKKTAVHPLSLPTVAALTPAHYNITILDEEIEPITFNKTPDLVGITAVIPNIKRAYEIADTYRSMGVPVVMGGAQVSFNVEETLTHVDTVVVGEAEGAWEYCLNDFEKGKLKPVYKAKIRPLFKKSPIPRWDLVKTKDVSFIRLKDGFRVHFGDHVFQIPNNLQAFMASLLKEFPPEKRGIELFQPECLPFTRRPDPYTIP